MAKSYRSYLPLVLIGVLAVALYLGAMSALILNFQLPMAPNSNVSNSTPTVNILLYMGELNGKPCFGNSSTSLTSPGPTLRFTTSDVVKITVINIGSEPHAFAITDSPTTGATVLFNAEIGSSNSPLQPGQNGSVIFTPNNAGQSFFYISPLPGQAEAGMYGSVIITTSYNIGTGM
jgi:FtsP/CotA-like multicopper oxidase with cupredoxin domain